MFSQGFKLFSNVSCCVLVLLRSRVFVLVRSCVRGFSCYCGVMFLCSRVSVFFRPFVHAFLCFRTPLFICPFSLVVLCSRVQVFFFLCSCKVVTYDPCRLAGLVGFREAMDGWAKTNY